MGANGATTTPYTLNGILQFLSVSTSVTLGGSLTVSATTASTSTTTGALVVGGGIGVGGSVHVGGSIASNAGMTSTGSMIVTGTASDSIEAGPFLRLGTAGGIVTLQAAAAGGFDFWNYSSGWARIARLLANGNMSIVGSMYAGLYRSDSYTPASATAAGTQGFVTWDANYLYVCTATDTWKRVAIATW